MKEKFKMKSMAEIIPIEKYLAADLKNFALPEVCNRVRVLIDSDEAGIDDIAQVIFVEPVIVSRIIKMANSSLYNLRKPVTTLSGALRVTGMDTAYRLLVTEFSCTLFKELHNDAIDMRRFWQQSFASAISSYQIARQLKLSKKSSESLYVMGLLHNIGELLVAQKNPELAFLISNSMKQPIHPFEAQVSQCGFTYTKLSSLALEAWKFPKEATNNIKNLHAGELNFDMPIEKRILSVGIHCGIVAAMNNQYSVEDFFASEKFFIPEIDLCEITSTVREASDLSVSAIRSMDEIKLGSI